MVFSGRDFSISFMLTCFACISVFVHQSHLSHCLSALHLRSSSVPIGRVLSEAAPALPTAHIKKAVSAHIQ